MTSEEWIFTETFLRQSASRQDGISFEKENNLRSKTIWFLEDVGKQFNQKINRKVISCACTFFHRYYAFHSFQAYNRFNLALACLLLASKVEECPMKLKDIVSTYNILKRSSPTEAELKEMHKQILICERLLLCTLNFNLNIVLPYQTCIDKIKEYKNYLAGVTRDDREQMLQTCINFINDSYRTTLCLKYSSAQIAMGAFYLTTLKMNISPNNNVVKSKDTMETETWFDVLVQDIDEKDLKNITKTIADMYGDDIPAVKIKIDKVSNSAEIENGKERANEDENYRKRSGSMEESHSKTAEENFEDEGNEGGKFSTVKVTYKGTTLASQEYLDSIKRQSRPATFPPHAISLPLPPSSNSTLSSSSTPVFAGPLGESPATFSDQGHGGDETPQFPVYVPMPSDTPEFPSMPGTPSAGQGGHGMLNTHGVHGVDNLVHELEGHPMKRTRIV